MLPLFSFAFRSICVYLYYSESKFCRLSKIFSVRFLAFGVFPVDRPPRRLLRIRLGTGGATHYRVGTLSIFCLLSYLPLVLSVFILVNLWLTLLVFSAFLCPLRYCLLPFVGFFCQTQWYG